MRSQLAAAAVATATILAGPRAHAAVVLVSQTYTADAGQSAPAGATLSLFGPSAPGGGLLEGPILIDAPADGVLTTAVTDQGLVGNVYEALLDGTSLGITSAVAVGGAAPSSGVFTQAVAAGSHQLDVWDFVQTYIFGTSPHGGDVTGDFYDDTVLVTVSEAASAAPVPEPAALATLLPAAVLTAAAVALRPRRRA